MNASPYRRITILFSILLATCLLYQGAAAQSKEEMLVLNMFYDAEDLKIITPTRFPEPLFHVASNVSVITDKRIREMKACSLAEVLNRIPGISSSFNHEPWSDSPFSIQGSRDLHVLLLVDGIPWNYISSGGFSTNTIPVGIIDQIEIIKGPASSSWGSSLGGVINVITKFGERRSETEAFVSATYGEAATADYQAGISGSVTSRLGYFLYAGHQESDGLRYSRYHDNNNLYSDIRFFPSDDVQLGVSMGYSEPSLSYGKGFPDGDTLHITAEQRAFSVKGFAQVSFPGRLKLNLSGYALKQKYDGTSLTMDESYGPAGEIFQNQLYDEKTRGFSGKLTWRKGRHSLVLGADYRYGELEQTLRHGELYQGWGAPPVLRTNPSAETWAAYLNGNIRIGNPFSLLAGIRYDHDDISGSFVSPSLGFVYDLGGGTMLRGTASRGFTSPPLLYRSGGALWVDPNPSLEAEEIWSCQWGVESVAIPYVWVKATAFYHDLEDAITGETTAEENTIYVNKGDIRRKGIEIEVKTQPVYNLSFSGGFAYTDISPTDYAGTDEIYTWDIGIRYEEQRVFCAQLLGRYHWMDHHVSWSDSSYKDFIWDFHFTRKMTYKAVFSAELFVSVHNLFDGEQHDDILREVPGPWVEGGIRFDF